MVLTASSAAVLDMDARGEAAGGRKALSIGLSSDTHKDLRHAKHLLEVQTFDGAVSGLVGVFEAREAKGPAGRQGRDAPDGKR